MVFISFLEIFEFILIIKVYVGHLGVVFFPKILRETWLL